MPESEIEPLSAFRHFVDVSWTPLHIHLARQFPQLRKIINKRVINHSKEHTMLKVMPFV